MLLRFQNFKESISRTESYRHTILRWDHSENIVHLWISFPHLVSRDMCEGRFFFYLVQIKLILYIPTPMVSLGTSWEEWAKFCSIVIWIKWMKFISSWYNLTTRNLGDFRCKIYSPNIINLYNKVFEYHDSKCLKHKLETNFKAFSNSLQYA